ncbi:hypothetical protein G6F57_002733 [Rhizopus arrhizus]|uniref:Uncharacterized protein n=1 Tax=Rhizopus oryzae TaxID=64495 RepID=A0A9P7BPS3_RHIOR|nr:hypothetical protein G6F21_008421 [Rhizopus arrhizus]KAG0799374.1 hypothetical protein G6F22_003292 [Rhizopus arrhizus]KAG0816431.1 hypothetical protein G6F20_003215 [Rhizopus arrhizus]KAG0838012.1 hypothetical protein G6F19_003382 [Rhizopus arrhizus]KAG0841276.1 hypothetical protein G6F18_003275 [Rhizopus arrhizus]
MFWKSEFLSQDQLNALHLYKYSAVDRSFTTKYILSHYWNWCLQFFPINMAPNLITLTGLLFMISNVVLTSLLASHMATGSESGPKWLYFSFAAGLWLYSTFDNVDGKQARRTNTSSPLGELFDHGCDAVNCSFAAILQAAGLGTGHTKASVILYGIAMLGFYLSTLEEYHTGTLYLGYINAPTEGVIISCVVFILSGIYGPEFWQSPLKISWLPTQDMSRSHALIWCIGVLFLLTHVPSCHHHFILFAITTGIVFGRMATKIILAHLTKSSFPKFTVLLVPLMIGATLTNLPRFISMKPLLTPKSEYIFLWAYFLFALIAYARWAIVVIRSFCQFLGIQCLRIPPQKQH